MSPGLLSTAGVILITICVISMLRRRLRAGRRRTPPRVAGTRPGSSHAEARARIESRRAIDTSLAEAEELVRRFAAHLDTKSARLEKLLRDADERLASLSALSNAGGAPSRSTARSAATASMDRSADPTSLNIFRLADEGLPPIEIAQRLSEGVGKVELILALRED